MKAKLLFLFFSLVVLIAGAAAGVYLVQKRQTIDQQAAVPSGSADMALSPASSTSLTVGGNFAVAVVFQSPSEPVSGISVKLEYAYTGDTPPLEPISVTENSSLIQDYNWRYPKKDGNCSAGNCVIEIVALQTGVGGYSSPGNTELATINFRVNSAGSTNLTFNTAATKITSSTTGQDILNVSSLNQAWTYSTGGTSPTNTPPAPTNTPAASPTPTATTAPGSPTNTPAPSATPTPTGTSSNPTPTPTSTSGGGSTSPSATPIPLPTPPQALLDAGSTTQTLTLMLLGVFIMLGGAILAIRQ